MHSTPHSRGRVLAVDDSSVIREVLIASLEAAGYSVEAVDSGHAALVAARQETFDAVILDVDMPGIDGLAVGRALRGDARTCRSMIAMHTSLDEATVRSGFARTARRRSKAGRDAKIFFRSTVVDNVVHNPVEISRAFSVAVPVSLRREVFQQRGGAARIGRTGAVRIEISPLTFVHAIDTRKPRPRSCSR